MITSRCWIPVNHMLLSKMVPFSVNIAFSYGQKLFKNATRERGFLLKTEQKSPSSNKNCKNGYGWTGP